MNILASPQVTMVQRGWFLGMTSFVDSQLAIQHWVRMVGDPEHAPAFLAAFVAGIRGGVAVQERQWRTVEHMALLCDPLPPEFVDVLVLALAADSALVRGAAQRVVVARPAVRQQVEAAARSSSGKGARKRYSEAIRLLCGGEDPQDSGDPLAEGEGAGAAGDPTSGGPEDRAPGGDEPGLLPALLAAWATTRDPALIEVIARVGSAEASGRPLLKAPSKGELETLWAAVAKAADPLDVPRLLAAPWPKTWTAGVLRMEALARFPPDPRIARALFVPALAWMKGDSYQVHSMIAEQLLQHGDVGLGVQVTALGAQRGKIKGKVYRDVAKGLAARVSGKAPVALLGGAIQGDLPALWSAVFDDPGDMDMRRVLADALVASGDPRGQFIALQLAAGTPGGGGPTGSSGREANALLRAHIDAWTPTIPGLERGARVFEGGFLVGLTAKIKDVLKVADLRDWRMVESLTLETPGGVGPLLDKMPRLRRLALRGQGPHPGALRSGREEPVGHWPSVEVLGLSLSNWGRSEVGVARATLDCFPNLATFVGSLAAWDWEGRVSEVYRSVAHIRNVGISVLVSSFAGGALRVDQVLALLLPLVRSRPLAGDLRLAVGDAQGLDASGWILAVSPRSSAVRVSWAGGSAQERERLPVLLGAVRDLGFTSVALWAGRGGGAPAVVTGLVVTDGEPLDFSST